MARLATNPVRRWRNYPLHREVDNRGARFIWKVVLGLALALVPFAVYLVQNMSFVETSYALEGLRTQETRLQEAERRYRIEKAVLEALPAVEARSGKELGLSRPPAGHVVVVSPTDLARPAAR